MNSAWVTLAATFVIFALDRAVSSSFSILILPLQGELSVSRATVTMIFTSHMLVYSIASLFSGLIIARTGPRFTLTVGGLLLGLGLACMAFAHTLPGLMLTFGLLCGAGIALAGLPAGFVILSDRFPTRIATAMGIAGAGMGVGVLLVIPAMQWGAERWGWRPTFLWTGVAIAVIVVLCARLQRMSAPVAMANAETSALASADGSPAKGPATPSSLKRMREVAGSWQFQGFAVTNFLMGSALFGALTHQVALVTEMGWAAVTAATTLGTVNVLRSAAGPVWGILLDRFGRRRGYGLSTALAVVGAGSLLLAQAGGVNADLAVVLFIACFGIGSAGTLPTNASLGSELFSAEERGIAWGLTETAYAGGAAFGSWIVGWLFDLDGNYAIGLALVGAQFIASYAVVIWLSARSAADRRVVVI